MNSKKTLNVGVSSSLIELKAELIKKQRELQSSQFRQKGAPKSLPKSQELKAKKLGLARKKNAGVDKRNAADLEELARDAQTYEKAKHVLEAKAKLYEQMQADALDYEVNEHPVLANALVDFQRKAIDEYQESKKQKQRQNDPDVIFNTANVEEDEMVEFVDTLGRTRRCPKSQLAKAMEIDQDLAKDKEKDTTDSTKEEDYNDSIKSGSYSAVPPPNLLNLSKMMTEEQITEQKHQKWDADVAAAQAKNDIHYQDVLFDEVRTHGVAYFGFSKDEEKRAEEIRELKRQSKATKTTREKIKKEKNQKSQQLKARLRKIRNKKRAKLGLPPLEDSASSEEETEKDEGESSAKKKKSGSDSEKEDGDQKEESAKPEMRPWDYGKPGVYGPKPINFDELDAKWLQERRTERVSDFAPPTTYFTKNKNYGQPSAATATATSSSSYFSSSSSSSSKYGNFVKSMESSYAKIPPPVQQPPPPPPPPKQQQKFYDAGPNLYRQSTQQQQQQQIPVPIQDELPAPIPDSVDYLKRGKGAEIAPPQTFDFLHGEIKADSVPKRMTKCDSSSISSSIEEGVRAMREQVERKQKEQNQKREKQSFFSKAGPEADEEDE